MSSAGGLGAVAAGDLFGSGGPIAIVRARAAGSHVVRVVYSEEPLHRSPAGKYDALNPGNYSIEAEVGSAPNVMVVGIGSTMRVPPAPGVVGVDERGFDLHTDRALVVDVLYRVTVVRVRAKPGGELGTPYSATFHGMVMLNTVNRPRNPVPLFDWQNSFDRGTWVVDDSGDLAPEDERASVRKRIFRRLVTPKGSFRFLPGYGVGLSLKGPMLPRDLQPLQAEIVRQIKLEPEVQDVSVSLELDPLGLLTVSLAVRTISGLTVPMQVQRDAEGNARLAA